MYGGDSEFGGFRDLSTSGEERRQPKRGDNATRHLLGARPRNYAGVANSTEMDSIELFASSEAFDEAESLLETGTNYSTPLSTPTSTPLGTEVTATPSVPPRSTDSTVKANNSAERSTGATGGQRGAKKPAAPSGGVQGPGCRQPSVPRLATDEVIDALHECRLQLALADQDAARHAERAQAEMGRVVADRNAVVRRNVYIKLVSAGLLILNGVVVVCALMFL